MLPSGATRLTAGSYVGRMRFNDVDVVIRPKRSMPSLLTLLAEVHDLTNLVPELAGYQTTPEIVDLLIQIFLRQIDGLVRSGLKRTYVNCEEELVPVRGRIDVPRSLALHMRGRARVWCSFEDFTLNCVENQALLAALLAISPNGGLLQARRRVAHKLSGDFVGVSALPMTAKNVQAINCDRLSKHYEPVLRLAQVILASMGLSNDFGGVESNGFLLNMNSLFEKFIYRRLLHLLSPDGITVNEQSNFAFDEQQQAIIRPDLVIQSPRGLRLVADTKYKDKYKPEPADLYQMLAYCRVMHVTHGILITLGNRETRRYSVCDGETTIEVIAVNLDGSIQDIHASVDTLACQIRERLKMPC
ncbi:MAG: hypothetical protein COA78_35445 [Blastopirellula sp.]|nr:MAG: hypothetical protein COA78_35445 [Blastopirellula sp.]